MTSADQQGTLGRQSALGTRLHPSPGYTWGSSICMSRTRVHPGPEFIRVRGIVHGAFARLRAFGAERILDRGSGFRRMMEERRSCKGPRAAGGLPLSNRARLQRKEVHRRFTPSTGPFPLGSKINVIPFVWGFRGWVPGEGGKPTINPLLL